MHYMDVDPQEFSKLMEQEDAVVIDVRSPMELYDGAIPGHIMINMFDPSFVSKIQALDKDKTYLIYCRSGNRSASACGFMSSQGFSKLYNLEGGIYAWNQMMREAS